MIKNSLAAHINRYVPLNEEEQQIVASFATQQTLKKKSFLLKEEQVCQALYFVDKGCLRNFFLTDKSVEHTTT